MHAPAGDINSLMLYFVQGRLEFDRNHVSLGFKRAQFILYDVKYLLSSVPSSFDSDLRKGFLHGLSLMLNLLVMMQGMDSVVRQVSLLIILILDS
jgi:E3 ubiquitin-protein ligase UBR2